MHILLSAEKHTKHLVVSSVVGTSQYFYEVNRISGISLGLRCFNLEGKMFSSSHISYGKQRIVSKNEVANLILDLC